MKILMVNKFLYPNGGSETYIFELGKELERQGHQVEYFGMEHEGRIVGNHAACYTAGMDFHTGKLKKLLYPFKIIYSREAKRKMLRVLEDFEPDVVHLNNFNFQLTPSVIYAVKKYEKKHGAKVRLVYTAHDLQLVCPDHLMVYGRTGEVCERCITEGSLSCFRGRCIHGSAVKSLLGSMENWLYKKMKPYRRIDAIVCPSFFLESKLKKNPQLLGRTVVLRNFIPGQGMDGIAADKQDYAVYFGRYSEEKGVRTLVEACRDLPEIPFVFAGRGELEAEVGNVPNIQNRGFLGGKELYELIAGARFSICASECPENCPFSVMESLMLHTPVIGADIGGIPELIEDGKTGILFRSGDRDDLQKAVRMLWEDRAQNDAMIENCTGVSYDDCTEYCKKMLRIYSGQIKSTGDKDGKY